MDHIFSLMYLPAISMGYAVPDGNFAASVHSVFRSALNLRLGGENYLLTLVVSSEGDLPQGIRLDTLKEFSFENFHLGGSAVCKDGILHFKNNSLAIQLSGARRWKCDLPSLKFDPATPAVSAAWSFVWEALNQRQKLVESEIRAENLFHASTRTGKALRELVDATRQYALTDSPVNVLIGLGTGLTPSGDDLLVGYLTGLWCTTQAKSERMQFLSRLGETIFPLSSRTNDISRTYLYHAAQGQVSSRLADLAQAIARGENSKRLHETTEAAFQVGHTSGMDAATGLLIGLAAWTSSENSTFRKLHSVVKETFMTTRKDLAKMIDHSLLHPTMTDADILHGCDIAKRYGVATVCIKPYAVAMCKEALKDTDVKVCSVIGFPHGNHTTGIKVAETKQAIQDGAIEIDMVINIGKALGGDWKFVKVDIDAVNQACVKNGAILKVIFETDYLQDEHIIRLCEICSESNVAFVKTSSGYGFVKQSGGDYNYKGATDHVLTLMRKHSAPSVQVKAAGGVRTLDDLLRVRALGVTRIGATATEKILDEAKTRGYA